ncbi:DUF3320 domain-containing protein [Bradyrhizobium sp. 160]|nr:DUF3320 domain-containing protein [Bradyrhizobium sp. 160]
MAIEGPIYLDVLVDRIARAHGFMRSGEVQKIVMASLGRRTVPTNEGACQIVWPHDAVVGDKAPYRGPEGRDHSDIRSPNWPAWPQRSETADWMISKTSSAECRSPSASVALPHPLGIVSRQLRRRGRVLAAGDSRVSDIGLPPSALAAICEARMPGASPTDTIGLR